MLSAAVEVAWPPFVLVTGLLLIGLVAHRDGLFEQAGRFLSTSQARPNFWIRATASSDRCPMECSAAALQWDHWGNGTRYVVFSVRAVGLASGSRCS